MFCIYDIGRFLSKKPLSSFCLQTSCMWKMDENDTENRIWKPAKYQKTDDDKCQCQNTQYSPGNEEEEREREKVLLD